MWIISIRSFSLLRFNPASKLIHPNCQIKLVESMKRSNDEFNKGRCAWFSQNVLLTNSRRGCTFRAVIPSRSDDPDSPPFFTSELDPRSQRSTIQFLFTATVPSPYTFPSVYLRVTSHSSTNIPFKWLATRSNGQRDGQATFDSE
jgi:hypothetical protein